MNITDYWAYPVTTALTTVVGLLQPVTLRTLEAFITRKASFLTPEILRNLLATSFQHLSHDVREAVAGAVETELKKAGHCMLPLYEVEDFA